MIPIQRLLLALVVMAVACPGLARAVNGDILFSAAHCGSGFIAGAADVTYDTSDSSLWVLDRGSGQICHYSLAPGIQLLGSINHPYGAATISNLTNVSTGLAFDPTGNGGTGALWVLNTNNPGVDPPTIRQMDLTGTALAASVPLTLPMANTAPAGLSYDPTNDSFWYRDVQNSMLVNTSKAGAVLQTVALPSVAANAISFGTGLHFSSNGPSRFVSYTFGDVLDYRVQRVLRVDVGTGAFAKYQIPLAKLYDAMQGGDASTASNPITGIALNPTGTHLYATTGMTVFRIDATQPPAQPPFPVTCRSLANGHMQLSWVNRGSGTGNNYVNVQVYRQLGGAPEVFLANLAGSATSYTDIAITDPNQPELLNASLTYRLVAIDALGNAEVSCEVRTGRGARLGHTVFAGENPYDLAYNSNTDEIYVTDNRSYSGTGRIFVYDTGMNLLRTITINQPFARGIAYNPDRNLFAFSAGSNQSALANLRFLDAATDTVLGSSIPVNVPGSTVELGAMTYDSFARDYLVVNRATGRMLRLEAEDNNDPQSQPSPGTFLGECSAPFTNYSRAVTYLQNLSDGTYLATIETGTPGQTSTQIEEFGVNCIQSPNSIPLTAIGGSIGTLGAVNGMLDVGNQLYVCGGVTRTIFRLLLAPGVDFLRGDANSDQLVNVSDVTSLTSYLFVPGGAVPECLDAADVNDDARIDISDPTYLIFFLFLSGPQPLAPYPAAGADPTFLDDLGC